jgi:SAM-dependent methyltransferase
MKEENIMGRKEANIMSKPEKSNTHSSYAQTLAGRAILLEIGARLGILDPLLSNDSVSVMDIASSTGVKESFVSAYYAATSRAGLALACSENGEDVSHYKAAPDIHESINEVGYILWGTVSCAPLISNAHSFSLDMLSAVGQYKRDGEHVARTSKWMGERDFYPQAWNAIVSASPDKIVDLGSGTCSLLIRCLQQLSHASGVGIDINKAACSKARTIVSQAGMENRISIIEAPIQTLITDPTPIQGAKVIHAGFVFHDLLPDEEAILDKLLQTFRKYAPDGILIVVDAIPYADDITEKAFSAALTFLHTHFMGRRFLTEIEWKNKLAAWGYRNVIVNQLGISGGRIFIARPT